ncbi:1-alkyl-2-acetylglycerophosphocholine esterase [Angomonas deanei]|nr:1-alkyl-2-acetylglycerophosphocholine esterase [Angomonas deanei]EPY40743.1 1-alkyl-2-acetylglycerophosphocholine esterase [Angomonas deanei]|eukprot:EPY27120.1 1-alkyl-2-acetylglycerophosphocholine esterase [Angomonas deanei]
MYGVGIRQLPARSGAPPLTVFYPLPNKSDKKMPWLPFSDLGFLRGMARYVKLPPFLLYDMQFTTVVAEQDAKGTLYSKNDKPHQLILFSHGLGGYGRLYSVLLMNLASRGAIVVAVDHMDASAAFCRDETNSFRIELDTTKKWERADREPQLVQRVKELQETLRRFSQTNEVFEAVCGSAKDAEVFRNKQYGVALVGHSFGGASVLATALAEETAAHGKVSAVVGLDPWHIPLDGPLFAEPIEKGTKKYTTPTLLFHSQSWYVWPESWDFFEKLEKTVKAQTFTSAEKEKLAEATNKTHTAMLESWYNQQKTAGTGHLSYTDMSVLSPVIFRKPYMTAKAKPQLIDWSNAVLKFAVLQSNPLPLPPPPPKGWPNPN